MHDIQTRAATIGSFALSVLAAQAALIAASHALILFQSAAPTVSLFAPSKVALASGRINGAEYYRYMDPVSNLGVVSFDLDADLSSFFTWNTKLIFATAVVEFTNPSYPVNQAVIWDSIIREPEDAIIHLRNQQKEYPVYDPANSLGGTTANLTLKFHVVPYVGFMTAHEYNVPKAVKFPVPKPRSTANRKA